MPLRALLKWSALTLAAVFTLLLLAVLALALFGWNWARGPLQDLALQKTGRVLHIGGDLSLALAWPLPRVRAQALSFANPAWATAPQMLTAETVDVRIDLRELLRGRLAFPEVRLERPRVFLEQSTAPDGAKALRKTWLLDLAQTDEAARIPIGSVQLDRGEVFYTDLAQHTEMHAALSTLAPAAASAASAAGASLARPLVFTAEGRFRGQAVSAHGSGGGVLAWRDDHLPYPLQVTATLGSTHVQAEGSVTSLLLFSAVDVQLAVRGKNLAALFPLTGMALPATPAYAFAGHLRRNGPLWRYESFTGRVGHSDLAGSLQVASGGPRPVLSGALVSRLLDLADLGPAIGARDTDADAGKAPRMLPDLPLDTAHWDSLDADVTLKAQSLRRAKALPLDDLQLRLVLHDRRLTLDPLNFSVAGGQLRAQVTLDGQAKPMRGRAKLQLRGVQLGRLLPALDLSKARIGHLDGNADLSGQGASVGRLLATADGHLSLVAQHGQISRLLMEQTGLHLLEILRLNLIGDQSVPLNCAVADFGVAQGVMQVRALVLDTAVNTVVGSGSVSLAQETLDLTLVPRTKVSSLLALRSPIYLRGSFSQPVVTLDTGRVVARGLGALALGLLNPLLALVPLFEAGPGVDSPCARLVQDTLKTNASTPRQKVPPGR